MSNIKRVIRKGAVFLLIVILLIAFNSNNVNAASKTFDFTYKSVTVTINSEATKFLKKAGKAKSVKKTNSCAYKGYDRIYVYKDFTLKTYSKSKKGKEYVNSIALTTKNLSTKEKVKLGSTKKTMIKAYGNVKGRFGVYTYTKGKTKLVIELNDSDKVASIQYMAK